MKLGAKIILGFVATNIIYLALSIVIFFSAQPVRKDTTVLSRDLLPMLDQASLVQYSTAMSNYMLQQYAYSLKVETLVDSLVYRADTDKYLWFLEESIKKSPELQASREIADAVNTVRSGLADFRSLVDSLPEQLSQMNSSLEDVLYVSEDYADMVKAVLDKEEQALNAEILAGSGYDILKKRLKNINAIKEIGLVSSNIVVAVMQARYEGRNDKLAEAKNMLSASIGVLKELGSTCTDADQKIGIDKLTDLFSQTLEEVKNLEKSSQKVAADAEKRESLADKVIQSAAHLRDVGNKRSQEVAEASSSTLTQVVYFMLAGVIGSLLMSSVLSYVIIKSITGPVNILINKLYSSADEVDTAANDLTVASNHLADGAKNNAENIISIAAALEELSSMTKRNAENSAEANTLMSQVTKAVAKADDSMRRVITAMNEISVSGGQIAKIIKTIDEIAFQTNLLALNAAVEAARAGEAGAGFAVVADEVRNLATRSAEAARNTADLIESTISNIGSGSEMVNLTAENFNTVSSHSTKVAELLSSVAEASKEQSNGINQINDSMMEMDKVTQSNASSSSETATSASGLSSLATDLLSAVNEMTEVIDGRSYAQKIFAQHHKPHLALDGPMA